MRLPNGYQEVEWIQSSGTQYINTGFPPSNNTKVQFKLSDYSVDSSIQYVFGSTSSWGNNMFGLLGTTSWSGDTINGHLLYNTSEYKLSSGNIGNGGTHTGELSSNGFYVDGTRIRTVSGTFTGTFNMTIFAGNINGTIGANERGAFKLYYFKVYESGILVREFIPCYRKSDGEIGLYDLIGSQFYTNQGTGTFTKGPDVGPSGKIQRIYLGSDLVRPKYDVYYSDKNREEYQSLVDSVGSVQFVDTGRRYRFGVCSCYIGNRIAVDASGGSFRKINLDTLTVISSVSTTIGGRIWYRGEDRILTRVGVVDFDGNIISPFSTTLSGVTPGLPGVVRANNGFDIYKGIVDGDNITFTKIGTSPTDQSAGQIQYGRLGAYLFNGNDNSGSGNSAYVNPETNAISTVAGGSNSRQVRGVAGADGKEYRCATRYNGWGKLQKVGTASEGFVGNSLSTSWSSYGVRFGKFLGNIVSGGMNRSNGTGNGYGSNSYFIGTGGTLTLAQSNAFAYDTSIFLSFGFIDENGWLYPHTTGGGSGVILKTNKTFTNLNWRNPFLWR